MGTETIRGKREKEEDINGEDASSPASKRQKLDEEEEEEEDAEAASPKMHAFENPLLPLASYDEDDEEEEERRRDAIRRRAQERINGGRADSDDRKNQLEDDEDDEDDEDSYGQGFTHGKRTRMIEVRRDCPYLDTVNRQVVGLTGVASRPTNLDRKTLLKFVWIGSSGAKCLYEGTGVAFVLELGLMIV
ncbi:hypothetical protein Cgig2_007982 [Carnegiea gigantea]|uniref:Uncharacterized protein n=1 Tax=Carnegiea gigantea TaxID=171969 RepID=A0A9Q1JKE1_9CARY|nr:hypothetical protein Cgig2_007982 [Carnegiea gigantea]